MEFKFLVIAYHPSFLDDATLLTGITRTHLISMPKTPTAYYTLYPVFAKQPVIRVLMIFTIKNPLQMTKNPSALTTKPCSVFEKRSCVFISVKVNMSVTIITTEQTSKI
mgnify:CR=1 FL=1